MAVGGVLSGLCFATIGPLAKIFDERVLLLFAGITPMIIGRVIMFPMGSEYPSIYEPDPDWGFLENDTTTEEPFIEGNLYLILLSVKLHKIHYPKTLKDIVP